VVVGNFNTPLSPVDKSSMQKKLTKNSRIEWHYRSNRPDHELIEYSIMQQHNIHSSQQPMELSPK
jgi:hypothetical protein